MEELDSDKSCLVISYQKHQVPSLSTGEEKKRTGVMFAEMMAGLSVSLTSSHPVPSSPGAPR